MKGLDHATNWWYAVGVMTIYSVSYFPGPLNADGTTNLVTQTELYVLKDYYSRPTASSVFQDNVQNYGPIFAIDGLVKDGTCLFQCRDKESIVNTEHRLRDFGKVASIKQYLLIQKSLPIGTSAADLCQPKFHLTLFL
jgi:hypothetical protein